ncbi:MAG TPA: hypothetical protein DF383_00665 [Deltaproteobacteria bacterium]|nr:hypothetical protein [Deltaproteobacteria bacterium]
MLVGLVEAEIEFVTVGGIACALNGLVRSTEDVDILVKRDAENIQRLLKFLGQYGEGFGAELNESDFADEEGALRVVEEFPLDIFTVMSGKHFEDFEKQIRRINLQGQLIPYLSREALIELKKDSFRDKDKMDVIQLKNQ